MPVPNRSHAGGYWGGQGKQGNRAPTQGPPREAAGGGSRDKERYRVNPPTFTNGDCLPSPAARADEPGGSPRRLCHGAARAARAARRPCPDRPASVRSPLLHAPSNQAPPDERVRPEGHVAQARCAPFRLKLSPTFDSLSFKQHPPADQLRVGLIEKQSTRPAGLVPAGVTTQGETL
jgi:hypothetical protein